MQATQHKSNDTKGRRAHIVLLGCSGSGKSTVGRILAQQLGVPLYDLDTLVAEHAGDTVANIFAQQGEASFREHEAEALKRALEQAPGVIIAGAGLFTQPDNRRVLDHSTAVQICLDTTFATAQSRLAAAEEARPLWHGQSAAQQRRNWEARRALYAQISARIATDNYSPEEVATQLARRLCV